MNILYKRVRDNLVVSLVDKLKPSIILIILENKQNMLCRNLTEPKAQAPEATMQDRLNYPKILEIIISERV
jgi:hypothetical protein